MRMTLSVLLGCIFLISCGGVPEPDEPAPPPPSTMVGDWPIAAPEAQGMDEAPMLRLDSEIRDGKYGYIDGMLVIRHGHAVFDRSYQNDYDTPYQDMPKTPGPYNYYNPEWHPYYRRGELHSLQSVTKSVTSALVGIALRRQEIASVEIPILPFFKDYNPKNVDARKEAITLEDLLTMRAGIDWDEHSIPYEDPENVAVRMERSDDWIQFVLDRPMAHEPGTFFAYSSGVSQLLSVIMKQSTGVELDRYAEEHLFGPLGIENYHWKRTPQGHVDTEGGLYLTRHDLAKIGYLYLQDGVWEGNRILPEGWVETSVSRLVEDVAPEDDGNNRGYGYQWWLMPYPGEPGKYFPAGRGYGGQLLFVLPEHDMVVVFTGWNVHGTSGGIPLGVIFDSVVTAVR